eukprot:gene13623-18281_t
MNDKHSEEFGYNEQIDASENVSRSTQWKYRQAMGLVEGIKDDVKAKARQKAFLNLRNPLSLCASLTVVSEEVDSELFFSSDDVSILVNGWDKPTLITTKEAQKILNEQNISISTTEDSAKRRLYDSNFVDFRKKPKVYKLEEKIYVMLCHPDISDEDHSNNNQSSSSHPPTSSSSSSSHPPVFIRKDPAVVQERFRKMALASDGALSQIMRYWMSSKNQIIPQFRYDQNHNEDPRGEKWIHLQEILMKYLDGASFNSIWSCLQRAEAFISKAFNKMNVESAFMESGVYPFNAQKILSRNPHFRKLSKDDADLVLKPPRYETPTTLQDTDIAHLTKNTNSKIR